MTAGLQRLFPIERVRVGSRTRTHIKIHCSRCPQECELDLSTTLPDRVISKKYAEKGWVVSRTRQHDICPSCIGVRAENELATRFTVTLAGKKVPTPEEHTQQVTAERDAKTSAILARHFPSPPVPEPEPEPTPPPSVPSEIPAHSADARIAALEQEIGHIRAALELQLEATQAVQDQNRILRENSEQVLRQSSQAIEAVARLASLTARQNETIMSNIAQMAAAIGMLRESTMSERTIEKPKTLPPCAPLKRNGQPSAFARRLDQNLDMSGRAKPVRPPAEQRQAMARERAARVAERRGRIPAAAE